MGDGGKFPISLRYLILAMMVGDDHTLIMHTCYKHDKWCWLINIVGNIMFLAGISRLWIVFSIKVIANGVYEQYGDYGDPRSNSRLH